ncbi:MAG TPA: dTMP kinase [Mucilaginibacter sp.]
MRKNLFIALEGIDGSGKSTQVKLLKEQLEAAGHKIYTTCEPTHSPIGKMIRDILTHKVEADERIAGALFVADRLDHILNKTDGILKKLEDGYTVITDRYYFSSYAYQSQFMDLEWVINANSLAAGILRPDVNIYIDITPEISLERISKGRETVELYETLDNLKNVRDRYLELFDRMKNEEQVLVINGDQAPEAIANDILKNIAVISAGEKLN